MVNTVNSVLIMQKNSAADAFKTASKRAIQKTPEATGDLMSNKIAKKLRKFQNIHNKIVQKQLQMSMIKRCLKVSRYLFRCLRYISSKKARNY